MSGRSGGRLAAGDCSRSVPMDKEVDDEEEEAQRGTRKKRGAT
jgi:hypothetical protein